MNDVRTAVRSAAAPARAGVCRRQTLVQRAAHSVCCALFVLLAVDSIAAIEPPRRLLLVSSDSHNSVGLVEIDHALRRALADGLSEEVELEIDVEHLDLLDYSGNSARADQLLVELLRNKYASRQPEIVFPIGAGALRFVLAHRTALFPKASVLYAHVLPEDVASVPRQPFLGGVVSDLGNGQELEAILHILPKTKRVILIVGNGPVEQRYLPVFRRELQPLAHRVNLDWWIGVPLPEIERRVAKLPEGTAILYLGVYSDNEKAEYLPTLALERISRASTTAPVFGALSHWVGRGSVGTGRFSLASNGSQLGALALRVMRGESAGAIGPVQARQVPLSFDARLLERWNIPRDRLPERSQIFFEEKSLWREHKGLMVTVISVILAQGLLLAGIISQKLARTKAERAESESRDLYASVANSLDERIALLAADGTILWANRAWREFARAHEGRALEPGNSYLTCVKDAIGRGQADATRTLESLHAVLSGREPSRRLEFSSPVGDPWRYEMRIAALKRHDGGALVTLQDVTDRWQSEERVRLALESLPFATFLLDSAGTIELVNAEAERLFRYERADLLGRPLTLVVPEFNVQNTSGEQAGANEPIVSGIRGDGSEVPVHLRARTLGMAAKTMILVSINDLSERRRLAAEVHRLREETAHFGRVAAVGEMSAAIAHELNQPLAGIMMNCQAAQRLLARESFTIPDVIETFGDIMADARRAGEVIQRLRLMLRKEAPDVRPIDLNETVKLVQRLVANDLSLKRSMLELELTEDLPLVVADRVHLQQVILNLLLNAADAMSEVALDYRRIVVRTRPGIQHTVDLEVRDSGPGIAPEVMPHMFEPFFTTKPSGMGMGLAIVRSIVESHGGRIVCANAASGGAVFTVTLPAAGGQP